MSLNRRGNGNARRRKEFWRQGRDLNSRGIAPSGFRGHRNTGLCDPGCLSPDMLELNVHGNYFEVSLDERIWNGKLQLMTK